MDGDQRGADGSSVAAVLETLGKVLPGDGDAAFTPLPGAAADELVPGHLYRIAMSDARGLPVTAQLYQGLEDLGGYLWEQDVRTLLRINAIEHPALPTVVNGGHDAEEDVGWVVTASTDYTLEDLSVSQHFSTNPVEALRHLVLLADALAILHSQGIVHRNLIPAAALVEEAVDGGLRVRLSRFEMSAIIQGILAGSAGVELAERVRQLQADASDDDLVHHPPERLDAILGLPSADPEGDRSDVFSLGVIAFRWFVGSPDKYSPADERVDGEADTRRDFFRRWHRAMLAEITSAEERLGLPPPLADVLRNMLDGSPGGRPTAAEVVTALTRSYTAIVREWQPAGRDRHRLMYMAGESRKTIFRWGWIGNDPALPAGQAELDEWLRSELHGARLIDEPRGARPFVFEVDETDREALLGARHVLLGQRAAWFCTKYRPKSPVGGLGDPWDELLLIKYVVPHHQLRGRLRAQHFVQDGLDLDLVVYGTARVLLEAQRPNWPSWAPLLAAVRDSDARPADEIAFTDALQWIVEYRTAETDAARFHFEVVDADAGGDLGHRTVVLRQNSERRRTYLAGDSLRNHIGQLMASLGDEIDDRALRSQDGTTRLRVTEGQLGLDVDYLERLDAQTIKVRVGRRMSFPTCGMIEPLDNWSDRRNLAREARAVHELINAKALVGQLRRPYTIRVLDKGLESAGKGLEGGADAIVHRLLTSYPFFALQGPPGTGKTTVAAHAIAAQLRAEPTMRVLVSAQSNGALDNLGIEIRRQLAHTPTLMYRVQPRNLDVVDEKLSDLDLATVTEREIKRMCASVDEVLRSGLDARLHLILGEWRAAMVESRLELARRIHRGATIVLATTAKSTREALDDWGRLPAFDWVVIEEAAKAWPTELAIPLTRGVRWTLIGDHKQLPAYRQKEFQRTLVDFAASDRPGAELVAQNASEIREAFELFASVFGRADPEVGPIDTLRTQFRMRQAIADTVSSAFYPTGQVDSEGFPIGAVQTHPSAEARRNDLTAPPALVERPLVWVDTSGSPLIDEPAWRNPGEADLIARLVQALKPARTARNLVVLTPYLDQRRTLEERLVGLPVETVHGYQGKQADIVIASLVRTTSRGPLARSSIGFLADPQITNVLLSRAQTLLILVGNLHHFEGCGDETWGLVTRLVRSRGAVVAHDAPSLGLARL